MLSRILVVTTTIATVIDGERNLSFQKGQLSNCPYYECRTKILQTQSWKKESGLKLINGD